MNKKLLVSLTIVAAVAAIVVGATTAFFSDTETSTGNTFTAGAIDLGIDNESYLNGLPNDGTTWLQTAFDLDDGGGPSTGGKYLFFEFSDLKPGDWGEDTISIHVNNNDAWVCADVTLTSDDDNGITEPEGDDGDTTDGAGNGELANAVDFIWWADDGDNVLEEGEQTLPSGPLGVLGVGGSATVTIADSNGSIYDPLELSTNPLTVGALIGAQTYYVGKAWCFGVLGTSPVADPQIDHDPTVNSGITCNGVNVDNMTQSDSMTADISFSAVQARNNDNFVCGQ